MNREKKAPDQFGKSHAWLLNTFVKNAKKMKKASPKLIKKVADIIGSTKKHNFWSNLEEVEKGKLTLVQIIIL